MARVDRAVASPSRFETVNRILDRAAELPSENRFRLIAEECGNDIELRDSVLRLLSAFEKMGNFMAESPLSSAPFRSGDMVAGRFRIVEKLGEGGMGSVYLAEDRELGQVALKVIRAEIRTDPGALERFRSEIRLARGIGHQNLCPVFEIFAAEDTGSEPITFFTMKYLAGETLAKRLARGALQLEEALRLARGIAEGLDALHREGIVHRDLKPGNIILTPDREQGLRPVITDFGLARSETAPVDGGVTTAGQFLGSPDYMAPEQFVKPSVTRAADIYAFGLIVFEMISGARPFPREDMLRTALRRATEDAPRLSSKATATPNWLDATVAQALARSPESRPNTASAVLSGGHAISLPRMRLSRRSVIASSGSAVALSAIYGIWRFSRQNPHLPDSPKLMLTMCTHADGDKDREIAATVDTLMRVQLQQSAHVGLLDVASINRAAARLKAAGGQTANLADARTAREVALRGGASYVLFGDLGKKADVYDVGWRLELLGSSPARERDHWDFQTSVREDALSELPAKIDRASYELRRKMGESQKDWEVHSRTPAELTTGSWEALQLVVRADEAWRAGNRQNAIDLLRSAVGIDPQFAAAYGRLGDYQTATGQVDAGLLSHQKAADLVRSKNLTDRESLQIIGMFGLDSGQYPLAAETYKAYRTAYPSDPLPYFFGSGAEQSMGRDEFAGRLLDKAIDLDPNRYAFQEARARQFLASNQLDMAERLASTLSAPAGDGWLERLRAAIRIGKLDIAGAAGHLSAMFRTSSPDFQAVAYELQACLAAERGQLSTSVELLTSGIRLCRENGLPEELSTRHECQMGEVLLLQNLQRDARRFCREALARNGGGKQRRMRIACVLARAGDIAEARKASVDVSDLPAYRHWQLRLEAEIALADGNARQALALAKQAPAWTVTNIWPEYLARFAVAAGDFGLADGLYQDLFSRIGKYWFQANQVPAGLLRTAAEVLGHRRDRLRIPENFRAVCSMLEITQ